MLTCEYFLPLQELFKNQLESLRLRISATNDYTNLLQQRVNTQWDELNTGTTTAAAGGKSLVHYCIYVIMFIEK